MSSADSAVAMESQPFRGHLANGVPQNSTYKEVYAENGRWYGTFKKGKYMFPIDETELERLDVFHKIFLVARRDVVHSAPLHNQETPRILDLGCGTGIWGIQMADKYPGGVHVGVDLNYIQPEFIPANMRFLQKDIEDRWQDLDPGSWDLIHMRCLLGSISNWPRLYAEIYRHLKPYYGYFEQVEMDWTVRCDDGSLRRNGYIVQWANQIMDAMDSFGRPMRLDSDVTKQQLADAGFDDIKEEIIQMPVNGWPIDEHGKTTGRWFNLGIRQTLQPLSLAPLCRGHGRTREEVQELIDNAREEVYSNNVRAYCTLHIFTARKPR
ncbi:S-adenosyl-L-methionine-dependent methyltransferase [Corynascus novoguineensis]|uniref:S-adenosyl-L-methionine-dependent methyltransferase n=1 Tax=Corynascus novoguineensis TaxID=1126955 RepID=A0AAN7HR13_9PEZI|nr:S-adenosyl-L-methionine-dependent methyltransferase [Corynascus novoguineensis]